LAIKFVLDKAVVADFIGIFISEFGECLGFVAAQGAFPFPPGAVAVCFLDSAVEGVVGQPAFVLGDEGGNAVAVFIAEAGIGFVEEHFARVVEPAVVDLVLGPGVEAFVEVFGGEEMLVVELLEVDQIGIAGVGGESLVG